MSQLPAAVTIPRAMSALPARSLADVQRLARSQWFVGREPERARALQHLAVGSPTRVLLVHGVAGIGKSTFLDELERCLRATDRPLTRVDLRSIPRSPRALVWALSLARQVPAEQILDGDAWPEHTVLVLDGLDAFGRSEGWLRDTFLAQLPASIAVVMASRRPPAEGWRADAGWRALTADVALDVLTADESAAYLERRATPPPRREEVLAFAEGHPLALALAADVVASDPDRPFQPDRAPELVQALVRRFVEHVPSRAHRDALELAALARTTSEALISDVLGREPALALFDWLAEQAFMRVDGAGLTPHPAARRAILADLRWRDRERVDALRARALDHHLERLTRGTLAQQQHSFIDAMYLQREMPVLRTFARWTGLDALCAEEAGLEDRAEIHALVARHEGAASADVAVHWLERQPGCTLIMRDDDGRIAALCSLVALERTTAAERALDPVAVRAWQYLEERQLLDDGRVTLNRHWMGRDTHQRISAAQSACAMLVGQHHYLSPSISHFLGVFRHPRWYAPLFAFTGYDVIPDGTITVGEETSTLVGRDWRGTSPVEWVHGVIERVLRQPRPRVAPTSTARALSRAQLDQALRSALRMFREPHRLASSPLLSARIVQERAASDGAPERVAALQALVAEATASLESTPRGRKLYAAIERTYLDPVGTQEEAAEDLDLPFSTYRRHLVAGVDELVAILWQREEAAIARSNEDRAQSEQEVNKS